MSLSVWDTDTTLQCDFPNLVPIQLVSVPSADTFHFADGITVSLSPVNPPSVSAWNKRILIEQQVHG